MLKASFAIISALFFVRIVKSIYEYFVHGKDFDENNFVRVLGGQEKDSKRRQREKKQREMTEKKKQWFREGYKLGISRQRRR